MTALVLLVTVLAVTFGVRDMLRREHAWRRIVAAGRVFNDTGTGDDRA